MKIRIENDNIRIRLRMAELEALAKGEDCVMRTAIGINELQTIIHPSEQEHLEMMGQKLCIEVPQKSLKALWESDEEGLSIHLEESVISIQKDYACLGRDAQANTGLFPNPKEADGAC